MSSTGRRGLVSGLLVAAGLSGVMAADAGPVRKAAAPVSHAANDADGTNWQSFGRTYSETHYSPLGQISDRTVGQLGLAWAYDIEPTFNSYSAPLEVDGVIYFATGYSVVHALDARTGKLLWRYDPEVWKVAGHKMRAGWGTRGIAYDNGTIFTAAIDGQVIAIDAKTGRKRWSAASLDKDAEAYVTGQPYVFRGKVLIGQGGADYAPVRGYVTAFDQKTGKQLWRFYTVPGNPAVDKDWTTRTAAKSWTGEWWKYGGGGTVWQSMAYDPKYNVVYLGTGNGQPWNQKIRSPGGGDNLFLASIVALDADTGAYKWHYQVNPGDTWDFNDAMDIELTTLTIGGRPRDVILHAPKNGFFYVIDRATGKLVSADKFAKVNWADRIDAATGRPVENPAARYPNGTPFLMYPFPLGAHGINPMSFSPRTGLAYVPVANGARVINDPANLAAWHYKPGMFVNTGLGVPPQTIAIPPTEASLVGYDPVAQKPRWTVKLPDGIHGGTMATAGNLVFMGMNTGHLDAFAADTGKKVWSFDVQNGLLAHPISYSIGGRQYITVVTGFRSSFANTPNWDYAQQKRRVLTFALGGKAALPPADYRDMPIQDDAAFTVDDAKAAVGRPIYNSSCVICHGIGMASGGAAPDLRKSAVPLSLEAFSDVVHGGALRANGMPQFDNLSAAEIEGLQHYIRQVSRAALAKK